MNSLKGAIPLRDVADSSRSLSPNATDGKAEKGIKKLWKKTQRPAQELRNHLNVHEDVSFPGPQSSQTKTSSGPTLSPINEILDGEIDTQSPTSDQTISPATLLSLPTATEAHLAGLHQNNSASQEHHQLHLQWRVDPQFKLNSTKTSHAEKRASLFMLPPRRTSSLNAPTSSRFANLRTPTKTVNKTKHHSLKATSNTTLLGSFSNKLPPLPQHLQPENQYSPRPSSRASPRVSFTATASSNENETKEITEISVKVSAAQKIPHLATKDQGIGKHFPPPPCPPPNYPPPLPPPQKYRQYTADETLNSAAAI
ncbi:hypothetical protein F5B21DRAFT_504103 [Xylaria acuta]|nr:hypothetical protein F5B21DRAFT_504103 [Xylaria acuta]